MEQSGGAWKSQIIILSLGGALALAFTAAHFFSPVSRRLSANEDIEIALLSPSRPMLFVYRPGAGSVDAIRLPKKAARSPVSALQRAHETLGMLLKDRSGVRAPAFYIEVAEPDLERFSVMLNTWRNRPRQIPAIAAYIRDLKSADGTNLSWHDLLLLSMELSRLRWADFIITDPPGDFFDKAGASADAEAMADTSQGPPPSSGEASAPVPAGAAVRLEVLNASGRKDLAGQITRYLRKKGFDVISFGNYKAAEKRTKIVNCSDDIAAARLVRSALGLKDLEIYSKAEKPAMVQVRVILGADFDEAATESPAFFKKKGGQ